MQVLDIDMVRGLVLIALLIGFLGICAWAWSSKQKTRFYDASKLPLEDDVMEVPARPRRKYGARE